MSDKRRGLKGKNPELRGGKNNLPQTKKGTVDLKKVIKEGKSEAKKNWVDKKVVKNTTSKGMNRLKQAIAKTKPVAKTVPIKTALKSTTNLTKVKSPALKKTIKTATPSKITGLDRIKKQIAKTTPSPKVKMKTRTPIKRKPPTKGR